MEKQYLYIFEDGNFKLSVSPAEGDFLSVRDGFLEIIDMDNKLFWDPESQNWKKIETLI